MNLSRSSASGTADGSSRRREETKPIAADFGWAMGTVGEMAEAGGLDQEGSVAIPNVAVPDVEADLFIGDDLLMGVYEEMLAEDEGVRDEALHAAWEMAKTPFDQYDKLPKAAAARAEEEPGMVQRRAPLNPFASPKLGRFRKGGGKEKVADPALRNNPLRGRLIVTMMTSAVLVFVFFQSLAANYVAEGRAHVPASQNPMIGPSGDTLYGLGGLATNEIRDGQHMRLYWSMWMHSGWIHIILNVLSQLQFLYMFEPDWGFWRTLFCFWISGISGNLLSSILDPCTVTVGSSGALYGLMGAVCVYVIEYWKSIPRPWCILIFTIIVLIISFITGFSGNTDNWAHLGGLIGGLLFSCMSISSLEHAQDCCCPKQAAQGTTGAVVGPDGRAKKKVIRRAKVASITQELKPTWKNGLKEWLLRGFTFAALFVYLFCTFWYLYRSYEYQPPGRVTFKGTSSCCCGYAAGAEEIRRNWNCQLCEFPVSSATWGDLIGDDDDLDPSVASLLEATADAAAARRRLDESAAVLTERPVSDSEALMQHAAAVAAVALGHEAIASVAARLQEDAAGPVEKAVLSAAGWPSPQAAV